MIGQRFERLVVIAIAGKDKNYNKKYECLCDCGNKIITRKEHLTRGKTKSCGCLNRDIIRKKIEDTKNNRISIIGTKKGIFLVLNYDVKSDRYYCQCDCGLSKSIAAIRLINGEAKCECQLPRGNGIFNGVYYKRLYKVWCGMKERCHNPKSRDYRYYGAKGRFVCDEWKNDFIAFEKWAMANGYNENAEYGECTIDRINNDLGYYPDNCRWVSAVENNKNRPNGISKPRDLENKKSGVIGVNWDKRKRTWEAVISINGKNKRLGRRVNLEDAIKLRKEAELKYRD